MGAWGEGAFDNDTAADWAWEFDRADGESGLRIIRETLEAATATEPVEYLDADVGQQAVAAAEVVAAVRGEAIQRSPYNEAVTGWIDRAHPSADSNLSALARAALARVTADNSELAALWDEVESSWRASIA